MILDSLSQPKEVMTMNLEQIVPIEKKWHEVIAYVTTEVL